MVYFFVCSAKPFCCAMFINRGPPCANVIVTLMYALISLSRPPLMERACIRTRAQHSVLEMGHGGRASKLQALSSGTLVVYLLFHCTTGPQPGPCQASQVRLRMCRVIFAPHHPQWMCRVACRRDAVTLLSSLCTNWHHLQLMRH